MKVITQTFIYLDMIINTVHISICTFEVQTEIYGVFAKYCYCSSNNLYHYYGKK